MNYDALESDYWEIQRNRVEQLRLKISANSAINNGQKVPEDDSLAIGKGRRLKMAVMFIDICDFSSRDMETPEEQESILRILNLYFTEMIRISEEYGGNVEKNTGDGLFVYFNDNESTPPEIGPKRAVACALTMMATTKYLINPILQASGAKEIDFRVSIDYGFVTVAKLGAPRRFISIAAIGTSANFASKMLSMAGPNEIVIGQSAKEILPIEWQIKWTQRVPEETGWVYRKDGKAYSLYKYTGRWSSIK